MNSYFLSINTALLAFDGYLASKDPTANLWLIGCAGIVLSVLWFQIITSYRDLNSAKFKVLGEIEKRLPLNLYAAEWRLMGQGRDPKKYRPLSHIERVVPWVFVALHLFVIGRSVLAWANS